MTGPAASTVPDPHGRWLEFPSVGRERELRRLRSHVSGFEAASPPVILLRGEAGVGKTRLIRTTRELAEEDGVRVFAGSAYPLDGDLSYAVWADALVPFLREAPASALQTLTRGRVPELLSLFPGAVAGGTPEVASVGNPEEARATLFWSFAELLRGLAARTPVLVVLEDLHWSDPSSIRLLHFAVRQLEGEPVRFVCSTTEGLREGNPALLELETSLVSSELADLLVVEPFSETEVGELITRTFGVSLDVCEAFARRLHDWSAGSPLFATETIRSLVEGGHLDRQGATWVGWDVERFDPPRRIQDLVASRLAGLSVAAHRVVEVAAVMRERVRFEVLAAVVDLPTDAVLDAIDELRRRGILEEQESGGSAALGFAHPLMRECVYGRLGQARTRLLHREVGDVLEPEFLDGSVDLAEELAFHFHRSGDQAPAGKALRYLTVAGRRALDRHANGEAVSHLTAALAIIDGDLTETWDLGETRGPAEIRDPAESEVTRRAELLVDLARALERGGNYGDAIGIWERVLGEESVSALRQGPAELRRRAGLASFWAGRYETALDHWSVGLEEACEDPQTRGRIRLARGLCLQELARWGEAVEDVQTALELADANEDARTHTRALQALALHNIWTGHPSRARELAGQAVEESTRSGDLHGAFRSHWGLAVLEGLTGNMAAMRERIDAARSFADELGSPILELWIDEVTLQEAYARGDWETAVMLGENAVARGYALGQRTLLPRLLVWTALPVLGRGDVDRGRELVSEARRLAGLEADGELVHALDLHSVVPAFIGAVSLHLAEGDYSRAIQMGEKGMEMAHRSGSAIWSMHHLSPLLAQAYMWAGDLEGAERVGRRLRRDSERMDHRLGLAWAEACEALVTWLSGDIEGGMQALRSAAERLESIPMAFDAARVRRQLAGRLAELGCRDEALGELRAAHAAFQELGAEPELLKTRGMYRELDSRPPPRVSREGPAGLTGRELEVAVCVAERLTNKAIARELGIAPRTVTTHLTNIYSKLGLGARGDLVDLVRERGWS